ncbi:MAG TPA: hypothetical protein VGM24_01250 [Puia sp.]
MRTQFFIAVNIKTASGPETIARFRIGNNPEQARQIYYLLKGDDTLIETNNLFLDLMEMKDGLPVNLKMISCTLDQAAENCRIIMNELSMFSSLEEQGKT